MRKISLIAILVILLLSTAKSQNTKNDILFAGIPHSFTIQKIETGDSVRFLVKKSGLYQNVKITGISLDTIFFSGGSVRINELQEIQSFRYQNSGIYYPGSGQIDVPPPSIYTTPATIERYKDKLANLMGFKGTFFPQRVINHDRNQRIKRILYLEYRPTVEFSYLTEKQNVQYTIMDQPEIHSGRILKISQDTLFFDGFTSRFRNFCTLKKMVNLPPLNNRHKAGTIRSDLDYGKADSASWRIFIPPDSIYANQRNYSLYRKSLIHSLKREAFAIAYNPLKYKNSFKINLAKLLHVELALSYERVIDSVYSLETEVGYIVGFKNADGYYTINYPIYNYSGCFIQTIMKYYYNGNGAYFAPVLLYKYLWCTGMRTGFPFSSANGDLQDQFRNDYGISIRMGKAKRYGQFIVDYYAGLGVKLVSIHVNDYGKYLEHDEGRMTWYHTDHSPKVSEQSLIHPIVNLGVKIGAGF